ncbi:histidinol-phosphatase, inositol monophosphatase family [Andreprevotia lacus DSM 23236]|jgi:histidinol phosphatase-like enzyme (inositol monophosphatase family)|uniref:Histidinol-phosphatase, inositol monophosphatase family n=1 Tax=Andreprevotia lacus DSM 23236 TaxID=1121001 RepID=A0A1W1XLZ1_9NEIS|nr:inositol monophosphatase family protein [Andreprevotia lacus]SMC24936.1 histidinol-phosphatase, inositol monophosphatase family [Andreprevotia lacus DSM 23236]
MTTASPAQIALAHQLADASAAVIRGYYRSTLSIDDKLDASPVTQADREAERVMRELIVANRPADGIIGEEFGDERADADWVWVLDPVDGTKSFTVGRPLFVTLIGLLYKGVPVLGIINQPIAQDRWIGGEGVPATLNNEPIKASDVAQIAQARIGTTGPEYLNAAKPVFNALADACRYPIYGGDGYLYAQVASGWLDLVIEEGLKLHDFAALAPVLQAAGGVMTDWQGKPLQLGSEGRVLAAANADLHAQVLPQLRALVV